MIKHNIDVLFYCAEDNGIGHLDVSDLSSALCALPLSHSCVLLSVVADKSVSDLDVTDGVTRKCHIRL